VTISVALPLEATRVPPVVIGFNHAAVSTGPNAMSSKLQQNLAVHMSY